MPGNVAGVLDAPLDIFGGLVTDMAASDLPLVKGNWEKAGEMMIFWMQQEWAASPALRLCLN